LRPLRAAFVLTHRIQYFVNLLDELHRRGNVEILAVYSHDGTRIQDAGFGRKIVWDNRTGSRFPEVSLSDSVERAHGPFLASFSRELAGVLEAFGPDVVQLNGYGHAVQMQAWRWCARHGVPYVVRGDGDDIQQKGALKTALRRALVAPLVKGALRVAFQGEQNRRYWAKNGASPEQLVWIPCVSDSEVFRSAAFPEDGARQRFRTENGAAPGDTVFVVSGKLETGKRPADAIEALAGGAPGSLRVWFLGSGAEEEGLRELASRRGVAGRVRFWGFRNQREIPAILQAADVLLHVSGADRWPYAVLEGAVSGLALLLSDMTGSRFDWMPGEPPGLVFPTGDVDALRREMVRLASEPAALARYQRSALAKAARYTEAEFCRIFESIAVEAAGRGRIARPGGAAA